MGASLNRVMIIGRLGRDPELRHTQGGTAVANLRVATDESWTDKSSGEKQEKTEWHTVVLWGRQAEIANEYLGKGRLVYVEGSLETRKWQDKDGADRYSTEIKGHRFQMLDSARDGGSSKGEWSDVPGPPRRHRERPQPVAAAPAEGGMNFDDGGDDIPF